LRPDASESGLGAPGLFPNRARRRNVETNWTLRDAADRLSEVIDRAVREGPQAITQGGKDVAVVVSAEQYRALTGNRESLVEFFQNSPLRGVDPDLSRDRGDSGRSPPGKNNTRYRHRG